jgi:UDP:flavonoid glycosyltransferase YjiC (YdhE family)
MNVLLTPVGSAGDNYPFIGLGAELVRRGHRVAVVTGEAFEPVVRGAGLEFVSIGTRQEYESHLADPDIWHPTRGFRRVMSLVGEQNRRLLRIVSARAGATSVVIAGSLDFVSRNLAEKTGLPVATMHLSPSILRTVHELPTLTGTWNPSSLPRPMKRLLWKIVDWYMINPAARPMIDGLRAEIGLPPTPHVFDVAIHSPLLTLGMWPAWFAAAQPDYPPFFRQVGFPMWDGGAGAQPVPADVEAYLAAGEPPIVFTPGSANLHAGAFFAAAVDAARRLGRRAMLLTRHAGHVPADLPAGVAHFPFAPLSRILSRCAALAHHGGIGTTAAAFAAGIPQLIMPMSHDQPDNAWRVRRLGVGERLLPAKFTGPRVAAALAALLGSNDVKRRCADVARRCASQDALAEAAHLVEAAADTRSAAEQPSGMAV